MKTIRSFSVKDIDQIAKAHRISVAKREKEWFTSQLKKSFEFLNAFDNLRKRINKQKATYHTLGLTNSTRGDKIEKSLSQKEALANTTISYKGYFLSPSVFDQ